VSLLVLPLGELARADIDPALDATFGTAHQRVWFDRASLRRQPLKALFRLWRERYSAAVLVAPDLHQPRLRLTSLLLTLVRADAHWRLDPHGRCEPWSLRGHLATNRLPLLRHATACALALAFGEVALRTLQAILLPRAARHCAAAPLPPSLRADSPLESPCSAASPPSSMQSDPSREASRVTTAEAKSVIPTSQKPSRGSRNLGVRRVLYLRSQLWLGLSGGGSVAHTAGVISGLQQLGIQIEVVSSDRLPGVSAPTQVEPPEVWFDGWLRELEDLAYNVAFLLGAWRAARAFKPRAIYQRHTTFNVAGVILARLLKIPLVLEYNSSEVWKGRYWGGLRLERAARLVERINLGAANKVVVVSRVLRDELVEHGVGAERIVVIPNGVDPNVFRPDLDAQPVRDELGLGSSVVVGFSGTFGAWHGIPTLAQALPLVLAARPNVKWLLIGDGPLRHLVEEAVAGDDRVILAGMVPHDQMPRYLTACDVLVSPHGRQADGREFFGSPTKLYEYMAAGRAIVASRLGQIAEVLEDEVTALLVEPDEPNGLADAIVRLVEDACLRSRLGCAAREAAVQRHTWRQNAERVVLALERA
jgi:glycosyltransferase involved in cell wall biosynthesis